MTTLFFKKNPNKEFTETKEPLDNLDEVEDDGFAFEAASVYRDFGWYPFLYESPFTVRQFGLLTDMTFGGGFDFPVLPPFVFPSGEVGGGDSGHFTTEDWLHEVAEEACDPDAAGQDISEFCESVMDSCAFGQYVRDSLESAWSDFAGTTRDTDEKLVGAVDAFGESTFSFANVGCPGYTFDGDFQVITCDGGGFCIDTQVLRWAYEVGRTLISTGVRTIIGSGGGGFPLECAGTVCGSPEAQVELGMNDFIDDLETGLNDPTTGCSCGLDFDPIDEV